MRTLKLLLILSVICMILPARATDKAPPENTEPQKDQSPSERAERPKREAVKMSPSIRQSPPPTDANGKRRRVAPPARSESPLQNVPALRDPPPTPGVEAPAER